MRVERILNERKTNARVSVRALRSFCRVGNKCLSRRKNPRLQRFITCHDFFCFGWFRVSRPVVLFVGDFWPNVIDQSVGVFRIGVLDKTPPIVDRDTRSTERHQAIGRWRVLSGNDIAPFDARKAYNKYNQDRKSSMVYGKFSYHHGVTSAAFTVAGR
ncbi:hypothetical protein [Crateriforma conspicua]|uniref:hypothetical protein n=1 Tax=Crateriforma conspicua TaxID=2527996 RepID=UPI00396578A2